MLKNNEAKQGRPRTPEFLRRIMLKNYRLPTWMTEFIDSKNESGGKTIERAMLMTYKDEIIAYVKQQYRDNWLNRDYLLKILQQGGEKQNGS